MSSRSRTKRNQKQALNRFPANTSTARRVPSHLNLSLKELNGSGQGTNYLLKHSQAPTSTVNLEHFGEGPIKRNKIGSPAEAGEFGDRTGSLFFIPSSLYTVNILKYRTRDIRTIYRYRRGGRRRRRKRPCRSRYTLLRSNG